MKLLSSLLLTVAILPTAFAKVETNKSGVLLYGAACSNCHAPNKAKAVGAPAAFDVKAWQSRYQHAKHEVKDKFRFKNIDDYFLYQVTLGKGLMHHGGLCEESREQHPYLTCDEKSYLEAIHYMSHKKAS